MSITHDPAVSDDDDRTLRPSSWEDFCGQTALTTRLRTKCQAAYELKQPLDHILITGPPGSGKTTLAHLAAEETGDHLEVITRPVDERGLMQALWALPTGGGIVFIDEAHRLPRGTQEALLTLTEQGFIQSRWGTEWFDWLTVILATTEKRLINEPLQSRCTSLVMDDYTDAEMTEIVAGMAERAHVVLDADTCEALGQAAVGVPRAARHLVLAARELAAVGQTPTAEAVLSHCEVDPDGLTRDHRAYLECLVTTGGQAGLEVLSVRLQLHRTQVQRIERLLVDRGYVRYDTRGRILTGMGRSRLHGDTPLRRAS